MAAAYLYDPDRSAVKRVVNDTAVVTVRGAGGHVLSEMPSRPVAAALEWVRDNIYAGGKLLGAVRNGSASHNRAVRALAGEATFGEAFGLFGSGVRLTTARRQPLGCPVTVSYQFVPGTATPTVGLHRDERYVDVPGRERQWLHPLYRSRRR